MKHALTYIIIFVFVILGINMVFGEPDSTIEIDENRFVQQFPKSSDISTNGLRNYFLEVDRYFADRFFKRGILLKAISQAKLLGIRNSFTRANADDYVDGKNHWLFLGGSEGLQHLFFDLPVNESILSKYIKLSEYCKKNNIKFMLVVGSNKSSIYPEYLPFTPIKQRHGDKIVKYLKNNGVPVCDPTDRLLSEKENDKLLYYRTDTHWNDLGAYIAIDEIYNCFKSYYSYFLKKLPEFSLQESDAFYGDLCKISGYNSLCVVTKGDNYVVEWSEPTNYITQKIDDLDEITINPDGGQYVIMLGDSFSAKLRTYLRTVFQRLEFRKNSPTSVDTLISVLEAQDTKPDIIIYEVVERKLEI